MDTIMGFRQLGDGEAGLFYGDAFAGRILVSVNRPGNNNFFIDWPCDLTGFDCHNGKVKIEWYSHSEQVGAVLDMEPCTGGYKGKFRAKGKGRVIVKLVWETPDGQTGFPFVPAFMYGCNEGGQSPFATYPQLDNGKNRGPGKPWVAKEWLARTDRSSHGVSSIIFEEMLHAAGGRDVCRYTDGEVAEKTGIGISNIRPQRITYSLGFKNFPFTYSTCPGRNYISRPEGYVDLDKGEVCADFFLMLYRHEGRQKAGADLLRRTYAILHDVVGFEYGIKEGIEAVADALVEYGYSREAKNFYTELHADERLTLSKPFFTTGWAGGLQVACPLLKAGRLLENRKWIECARDVIDNIAANGLSSKTSLFFENYDPAKNEWNTRGWWYGSLENPGHSGYVNGQTCYFMLLAYEDEGAGGKWEKLWLESAAEVLDHVIQEQGADGRFGYTYSEKDGSILDGEGFSGCWFTPALSVLYRITGDTKYLASARKAMNFYREFVEGFHVYGGPHDIYKSPDEEGILAWMEASRILHEITKEDRFLKDLLMGLDYEFSWKFAYNVANEVEPLKSLEWCSTGGSVTSVNNSHIHPMGSMVAGSILYAAEITGDEYYRLRLADTIRWTLNAYLHYDGEYGWGKKGMINERFCYTDSLLLERYPDGSPASTWFCAHSWASGSVLSGLTGIYEAYCRDRKYHVEKYCNLFT